MLLLPTGQVLFSHFSDLNIYTPAGAPNPAWAPTISSAPSKVLPGQTYQVVGTQFNGLSQGSAYGDDLQAATNYPLVRITNRTTGHVFYARTHDHSTMGVATGNATVSTFFDVPATVELGSSDLVVVANGIPSASRTIRRYQRRERRLRRRRQGGHHRLPTVHRRVVHPASRARYTDWGVHVGHSRRRASHRRLRRRRQGRRRDLPAVGGRLVHRQFQHHDAGPPRSGASAPTCQCRATTMATARPTSRSSGRPPARGGSCYSSNSSYSATPFGGSGDVPLQATTTATARPTSRCIDPPRAVGISSSPAR